jgi:hypothetical protein
MPFNFKALLTPIWGRVILRCDEIEASSMSTNNFTYIREIYVFGIRVFRWGLFDNRQS